MGRRKLLRAAQRGDRGARERLVRRHLGLVRGIASRYRDLGLPFDDLVQEGSIGLLEAIDHYDPSRGVQLESYARFRVRRAIRNALTDQARLIRLPKQVVERRRAIEQAEARLTAGNGEKPTLAQVAAATGLAPGAVQEALRAAHPPLSLDQPILPDSSALDTVVADPAASDPADETVAHERREQIRAAVARLPSRQRRVLTARWGLAGSGSSAAEVAAELGLSPRRAQTIAADALDQLRTALDPATASR